MKHLYTSLKLIAGAVAAAAVAVVGPSASAQTATTPSTSTAVPAAAKKPPTSATPQMISEAIQRSKARSEKAATTGKAEQWGSEEPFTFDPNK